MSLGEQIKEAREGKNYSQEELAEMCGVSRQAVSKWENGLSVPQGANREALCEILGLECLREENLKEGGEAQGLKGKLFIWGGWATAAVLNAGSLQDKEIHGHVTFQLNYGEYTVNSETYNIFYAPPLPISGM